LLYIEKLVTIGSFEKKASDFNGFLMLVVTNPSWLYTIEFGLTNMSNGLTGSLYDIAKCSSCDGRGQVGRLRRNRAFTLAQLNHFSGSNEHLERRIHPKLACPSGAWHTRPSEAFKGTWKAFEFPVDGFHIRTDGMPPHVI